MPSSRPEWKEQIDNGEIGFHDPADQLLIGLDTPPQTEDYGIILPKVMMSDPCIRYIQDHGSQVGMMEFFVNEEGTPSQFYPLSSAGACDKDIAEAIKESAIIPGKKNGQPKAALVHLRIDVKLGGKIR